MNEPTVKKSLNVDIVRSLIRPYITFSSLTTMLYLVIIGKLEEAKWLAMITGPIIGYYFGERAGKKAQ